MSDDFPPHHLHHAPPDHRPQATYLIVAMCERFLKTPTPIANAPTGSAPTSPDAPPPSPATPTGNAATTDPSTRIRTFTHPNTHTTTKPPASTHPEAVSPESGYELVPASGDVTAPAGAHDPADPSTLESAPLTAAPAHTTTAPATASPTTTNTTTTTNVKATVSATLTLASAIFILYNLFAGYSALPLHPALLLFLVLAIYVVVFYCEGLKIAIVSSSHLSREQVIEMGYSPAIHDILASKVDGVSKFLLGRQMIVVPLG